MSSKRAVCNKLNEADKSRSTKIQRAYPSTDSSLKSVQWFEIERMSKKKIERMIKRVNRQSTWACCWKEQLGIPIALISIQNRLTYIIAYCFQKESNSKQTKDSLTKVQRNILTNVLTYAPSSINAGYRSSPTVYKTSYRRLFSLVAISVASVLPYASFTSFMGTTAGHYDAFFFTNFFSGLECIAHRSLVYVIVHPVLLSLLLSLSSFFLFFLNALWVITIAMIVVTQC